jgi:hypothetical protein
MARAVAACILSLLLLPGLAHAATSPPGRASRSPWATVNVCDTAKRPNAIGIRASMPGAQRARVRLLMRFRVQWRDPADGRWHNLLQGGDSGFVSLGSSRAARQTGQVFRYQSPGAGRTQRLRGVVEFRWQLGQRVVRHTSRVTEAGHRSAAGSDPKGYSAASCTLKG